MKTLRLLIHTIIGMLLFYVVAEINLALLMPFVKPIWINFVYDYPEFNLPLLHDYSYFIIGMILGLVFFIIIFTIMNILVRMARAIYDKIFKLQRLFMYHNPIDVEEKAFVFNDTNKDALLLFIAYQGLLGLLASFLLFPVFLVSIFTMLFFGRIEAGFLLLATLYLVLFLFSLLLYYGPQAWYNFVHQKIIHYDEYQQGIKKKPHIFKPKKRKHAKEIFSIQHERPEYKIPPHWRESQVQDVCFQCPSCQFTEKDFVPLGKYCPNCGTQVTGVNKI